MQEFYRFRTQLGGFNRADVAEYIEKTAKEHNEELFRLRDELIAANEQVRVLQEKLQTVGEIREQMQTVTAEMARLQELFAKAGEALTAVEEKTE